MTPSEIESSGIYEATRFAVTLKNGSVVEFRGHHTNSGFTREFQFNAHYNVLQAHTYYDAKGIHSQHIAIKGEDIVSIEILMSKDEGERINNKENFFVYLLLVLLIAIGLFMCGRH
jgi:hypothetical protein